MNDAETVDQYDMLKRVFDVLEIAYEEWESSAGSGAINNVDSRVHKQSLDVTMKGMALEFWFSDGKFSHIYNE